MGKVKRVYCCNMTKSIMERAVNGGKAYGSMPIDYDPSIRWFYLRACDWDHSHMGKNVKDGFDLIYCPWCGTKFSKCLKEKKAQVLHAEYPALQGSCSDAAPIFPAEFQTDEWWKKRGL
jgi:hypothetical protein